MNERSRLPVRNWSRLVWLALAVLSVRAICQSPASGASGASSQDLSIAIQELRAQVQEMRPTITEMKSEAAACRAQTGELRKEIENMRANTVNRTPQGAARGTAEAPTD